MARINTGDIFELKTPVGNAYLHFIDQDSALGHLIRILPGLHDSIPVDLEKLAEQKEQFMIFFPLSAAQRRGIVHKVGHVESKLKKPQFMRDDIFIGDEFKGWDIVDTHTWIRRRVQTISTAETELSPWGIWNDTLLIEKLSEGWTLQKWSEDHTA